MCSTPKVVWSRSAAGRIPARRDKYRGQRSNSPWNANLAPIFREIRPWHRFPVDRDSGIRDTFRDSAGIAVLAVSQWLLVRPVARTQVVRIPNVLPAVQCLEEIGMTFEFTT